MKRVILGLGVVVFAAAIIAGTTGAYFTDSESTGDNTFHAGTLSIDLSQDMYASLPVIVDNWAPGEDATVEFDVLNTGTLPVHLRSHHAGRWDFAGNPNYVKVLKIERFNDVNSTWVPMVENTSGVNTAVYYSPNGTESGLIDVLPGQKVRFRHVVLFDPAAGNEYQGRTFTTNITVDAKQITPGATWPDSSSVNISCPTTATLSITRSESGVIITWPISAQGYILESASSLSGPWNPVDADPTIVGGCFVVAEATSDTQFYRLTKASGGTLPVLQITSPAADADLIAGRTYTITWSSENLAQSTDLAIQLKNVATGVFSNQFTGIKNTGSVQWTVPAALQPGRYMLSINNCLSTNTSSCVSFDGPTIDVLGASNGGTQSFSIIAPVNGATITKGTTIAINWTSANVPSTDKIALQIKNVATNNFTSIAASIANNGSYNWSIPSTLAAGTYEIHINNCLSENTSACVTIVGPTVTIQAAAAGTPTISITAPSAGATIVKGSVQRISWTSSLPSTEKITLQLKSSAGTFSNIATNVPNLGNADWNVPSTIAAGTYEIYINNCTSANASTCVTAKGPAVTIAEASNASIAVTVTGAPVTAGNQVLVKWTLTNIPNTASLSIMLRNAATDAVVARIDGIPASSGATGLNVRVPTGTAAGSYEMAISNCTGSNASTCGTGVSAAFMVN